MPENTPRKTLQTSTSTLSAESAGGSVAAVDTSSATTSEAAQPPTLWSQADAHWMDHALALAQAASALGEVPVGCVIVDGHGESVGEGANRRELDFDPTAHAEMLALRAASQRLGRWRLSDCTLYVTLEPCFMCAGAIVQARIGRVVYAACDPKAGAAGSLANVLQDARLNHRCVLHKGLRAEPAGQQLKEFFASRRKKKSV